MKAEKVFLVFSVFVLVDAAAKGKKTFLANVSISITIVEPVKHRARRRKDKLKEYE